MSHSGTVFIETSTFQNQGIVQQDQGKEVGMDRGEWKKTRAREMRGGSAEWAWKSGVSFRPGMERGGETSERREGWELFRKQAHHPRHWGALRVKVHLGD